MMAHMKFIRFARLVARPTLRLIADVQASGMEHIPATGSVIVASNHLGRLDAALAVILSNREDFVLMVAEKYQKSFFWRWVMKKLDALWLNRYEADFDTLREVIKRVKGGQILAMAPEGTRSKTMALMEGKEGVAFLAAKTGAPVIPVAVWGTEDRRVVGQLLRLRRITIYVRVGRPYYLPPLPRGPQREGFLRSQTDEVMCQIAAMLPAEYRGVYADHGQLLPWLRRLEEEETAVSPRHKPDHLPGLSGETSA
jgi:1-acyl-sn-glycerol-3-phosphate acyltransferase